MSTEARAEAETGWFEFIIDKATTHIAYVHEDGSVYLPEGREVVDEDDFTLAKATGRMWRLVREDDAQASRAPSDAEIEVSARVLYYRFSRNLVAQWEDDIEGRQDYLDAARAALAAARGAQQ